MLYLLFTHFNLALTLLKQRFHPKFKHILNHQVLDHAFKMDNNGKEV